MLRIGISLEMEALDDQRGRLIKRRETGRWFRSQADGGGG